MKSKERGKAGFFTKHIDLITIFIVIFTVIMYPYIFRVWDYYRFGAYDKDSIRQQWIYELYDVDKIIFESTNYLRDVQQLSQDELINKARNGAVYIKSRYYILHRPTGKVYTNEPTLIGSDVEKFLNEKSLFYYKVDESHPSPGLKIDPNLAKNISDLGDYEQFYWITKESMKDSNGQYVYMWQTRERAIKNTVYIGIYGIVVLIYVIGIFRMGSENFKNHLKESRWIGCLKGILKYLKDVIESLGELFKIKTIGFKFLAFLLGAPIFMMCALYVISWRGNIFSIQFLYVIAYGVILIPMIIKDGAGLSRIIKGSRTMAKGDLNTIIKEEGSKELKELAHNINKINTVLKTSIDDQVKNERLKSELVANVSHDLKTPLTSIINYTDLLGRENLTEEERQDYIGILHNKSLRLKALIEDLFEVSKMNSGKVEIEKSEVDIIELINQSIGELSSLYEGKNIEFRIKAFNPSIIVMLDGKKMARVFENIICNALKYSLENTRVYIDVIEINHGIQICFKNISAYEMNFDVNEIFERFTRGDSSRNSNVEGSGLGLAIARGIIELHEGKMYIKKDGDMFKVFIELRN